VFCAKSYVQKQCTWILKRTCMDFCERAEQSGRLAQQDSRKVSASDRQIDQLARALADMGA
jgi:hypothetical protein